MYIIYIYALWVRLIFVCFQHVDECACGHSKYSHNQYRVGFQFAEPVPGDKNQQSALHLVRLLADVTFDPLSAFCKHADAFLGSFGGLALTDARSDSVWLKTVVVHRHASA